MCRKINPPNDMIEKNSIFIQHFFPAIMVFWVTPWMYTTSLQGGRILSHSLLFSRAIQLISSVRSSASDPHKSISCPFFWALLVSLPYSVQTPCLLTLPFVSRLSWNRKMSWKTETVSLTRCDWTERVSAGVKINQSVYGKQPTRWHQQSVMVSSVFFIRL